MPPLIYWIAIIGIILSYMTLWYGVALYMKRYDVVDTAWGLGFILLAWVSVVLQARIDSVQIISAVLVTIWGVRLSSHIARRTLRNPKEDSRYEAMRLKWGSQADHRAYTNIFLVQGLLVVLVSLPMIAITFSREQANLFTYLGWLTWITGIGFETIADRQLSLFIKHRAPKTHLPCTTGLWHYSRHPNYFGEIVTWCGAAIASVSLGAWWGIAGAIVLTLLITRISGIPLLERQHMHETAYLNYRKQTSVLIPLPSKK